MLKQACEKYAITYVDLYNKGNFNAANSEQWHTFMGDWVHINEAGYRRFWPLIRNEIVINEGLNYGATMADVKAYIDTNLLGGAW